MSQILFIRRLTGRESGERQKLIRTCRDARVVRRAQVVRLSARGQPPSQIADRWERSDSGVRKIINRFNAQGLASLTDPPRRGRPPKTTDRYVALLKEAVQTNPRGLGYPFSNWTLERLREHLALATRVVLRAAHLSRLMRAHRIVSRRPKQGMSHLRNPQEYHEKKAFLAFVKKRPCGVEHPLTCSTSTGVTFLSTQL